MKLRAVRLANVGTFSSPTALEGLSGRLDVLVGPNELGKSTIFRALKTVFTEKHTVGGKTLEALRARAGGEPLIEADFDIGSARWRITKRFGGKGRRAALVDRASARVVAEGPDADEALQSLLARQGGPGAGLALLWAEQGAALKPDQPADAGRSFIDSLIEREVETAAGGELARRLAARVTEALERNVQAKRRNAKANSDYERALIERERCRRELDAAHTAAAASAERVAKLGDLTTALATLDGPGAAATREVTRAAAEEKLAHGRHAAMRLKTLRADYEARARVADRAATELKALDADLQQLAGIAAALATMRTRESEIDAATTSAGARLASAEAAYAEAVAAEEGARKALSAAEQREARLAAARELEALTRKRDAVATLAAEISREEEGLALFEVDESSVAELEKVERELDAHAARRNAGAASVRIAYESGRAPSIRSAGAIVPNGGELLATETIALEIPGIGRITITPAESAERDAADAAVRQLSERKAGLLLRVAAPDVATARSALDQLRTRGQALHAAKARCDGLAPGGLTALDADIALLTGRAGEAPVEHDAVPVETRAGELAVAGHRMTQARVSLTAAVKASEQARANLAAIRETLARESAAAAAIEARLPPSTLRAEERARRAAAHDTAAAAAYEIQTAVETLAATAPDADAIQALEHAAAEATSAGARAAVEAGRLRVVIATLDTELRSADEAGAGTRVAELEGELTRADAAVARFEREVAELILLGEALAQAEAGTRDRYVRPVVARIAPYLELVLPQTRISFGEGYAPMALERAGIDEVIGSLSRGTQEQIAILIRLGFGRLLAETGAPAPLVLDDALVYADDVRMKGMFRALALAAETHQVLLLTCRAAVFDGLGGTRLALTPWQRVEAQVA